MRVSKRSAVLSFTAVASMLLAASPALAGPPWISVEFPTNPHHPSTRHAAFLVRVYHHATSIDAQVAGRAEGRVDGRRTSVPLTVSPTSLAGVYAVSGVPSGEGEWVVVITMANGAATASALVTLGPDGGVVDVDVPSNRTADGWVVPRAVTDADIEMGLRQAAAMSAAYRNLGDGPAGPAGAALPLLLLVPVGVAVAARARRDR